jgi:cell wall-associated NlpC family hydrolase
MKNQGPTKRELAERARVVAAAESYHGTTWVHMGRAHGGVDCAGLLICSFYDAKLIPWVDTGYYPPDFMMHSTEERFLNWVEKFARKVERPALPGDIILYKHGLCISHGSIVITWPRVIHAVAKSEKVEYGDSDKGKLARWMRGVWSLNKWS